MPEMRRDQVTGNWVILSAQRVNRPHDFAGSAPAFKKHQCVFCPGQESRTPPEITAVRPDGALPDSPGWLVRIFPNKFPAVNCTEDFPGMPGTMPAVGYHEVLVDSPDHDMTLGNMSREQAELVILTLLQRYRELQRDERVRYIQVFKNWGQAAGASMEHTHWQIITLSVVPPVSQTKMDGISLFRLQNGSCPYCLQAGKTRGTLVVDNDRHFTAVTPFAPRFPYESWIIPKVHRPDFGRITDTEARALARLLRRTIRRYELALTNPSYNLVLQSCPAGDEFAGFHWHLEILPRKGTAAGFEWGTGMFVNTVTPEEAATMLRNTDPDSNKI